MTNTMHELGESLQLSGQMHALCNTEILRALPVSQSVLEEGWHACCKTICACQDRTAGFSRNTEALHACCRYNGQIQVQSAEEALPGGGRQRESLRGISAAEAAALSSCSLPMDAQSAAVSVLRPAMPLYCHRGIAHVAQLHRRNALQLADGRNFLGSACK